MTHWRRRKILFKRKIYIYAFISIDWVTIQVLFPKKNEPSLNKKIYFITKCFFKDRFIFVIQQFFVKKGPVPEKTSCSPFSSWSTVL